MALVVDGLTPRPQSRLSQAKHAVTTRVSGRGHWPWLAVLAVMGVFAVFGEHICPINPYEQFPRDRLLPPMSSTAQGLHLLGTDALGRDYFGQVVVATRLTLFIAFTATMIGSILGTLLGMVAGFKGGVVDRLISRLSEVQTAMPMFLIAILLVSLFGASLVNLLIVLPALVWPSFARIARAETLRYRGVPFVEAAAAMGARPRWLIARHVLPNISSRMVALTVISVGQVMLAEAGLDFLGAGVQPPHSTWGLLVSTGRPYLSVAWWLTIFPGVALALSVLSLNLLSRRYVADLGAAA